MAACQQLGRPVDVVVGTEADGAFCILLLVLLGLRSVPVALAMDPAGLLASPSRPPAIMVPFPLSPPASVPPLRVGTPGPADFGRPLSLGLFFTAAASARFGFHIGRSCHSLALAPFKPVTRLPRLTHAGHGKAGGERCQESKTL